MLCRENEILCSYGVGRGKGMKSFLYRDGKSSKKYHKIDKGEKTVYRSVCKMLSTLFKDECMHMSFFYAQNISEAHTRQWYHLPFVGSIPTEWLLGSDGRISLDHLGF